MTSGIAQAVGPSRARGIVWWSVAGSAALYVVSLYLPALLYLEIGAGPGQPQIILGTLVRSGGRALSDSLLGPILLNFAGVANLLLFAAWVQLIRRRFNATSWCAGLAILFSLQTFQLWRWPIFGGAYLLKFVHPLVGWYVWVVSMLIPLLTAVWLGRQRAHGETA